MAAETLAVAARTGDDHRLRRDLGAVGLLFAAVGSVVGSGWLFGALDAAEIASARPGGPARAPVRPSPSGRVG